MKKQEEMPAPVAAWEKEPRWVKTEGGMRDHNPAKETWKRNVTQKESERGIGNAAKKAKWS